MKKTSIFLLILTMFIIFSAFTVQADTTRTITASGVFEGRDGNADWVFYSDGELVVTGTGVIIADAQKDDKSEYYPWYKFRTNIKKITVGEGITVIGSYMFYNTYANSVSLPTTLTSIGSNAFAENNYITSLSLPSATKTLGSYAFYSCDRLTTLSIHNVTSMGQGAFEYCSGLTSVTVSTLGTDAFRYCSKLRSVTILNPTISVPYRAFTNCSVLSTVYFAGTEAQWNTMKTSATNNSSIQFANAAVKYIRTLTMDSNGGEYSINPVVSEINESGDTVAVIPSTAPTREGYTFYGWGDYKYDAIVKYKAGDTYTLTSNATIYAIWETPEGVIAKGTRPNSDISWILYEDGRFVVSGTGAVYSEGTGNEGYEYSEYRSKIKDVIINEGPDMIGSMAFMNTGAVRSVSLPNTIKQIGNSAFAYKNHLKEITIPDSVTFIGTGAFLATDLETVNLGNPKADISTIFTECTFLDKLNTITVDENNEIFTVYDGALYSKDMKRLIRVPATASGQFVIPDTVVTVDSYAFASTDITSVVVPTSVKTLNKNPFYGAAIKKIYYKGTEEEWKKISITTEMYVTIEYEYGKVYNITYNANGGENAPAASEKVKGTDIVLSDVTPTRAGYEFLGWATTKNATVAEYQPKDTYTTDSDLTLYAVWDMKLPDVTFTKNARLWTFDIKLENHIDNHTAYAVIYDKDGKMLNYDFYKIKNASSYLLLTPDSNATEAKIFVWGDDTNKPYTKAYPISLQQ